jgi:chromate transporter
VDERPALVTILREWGRIGFVGFGGPPAHIRLLRELCVERRGWLDPTEFEDALAACNLLPGPASTQLAIFCAWRLRGRAGALAGGAAFIVPGLILILALAALFLSGTPPAWVRGAGAGAGAAVAAVAVQAGASLIPASWRRARQPGPAPPGPAAHPGPGGQPGTASPSGPAPQPGPVRRAGPGGTRPRWARYFPGPARGLDGLAAGQARWLAYLIAGVAAAATIGPWLVLVLLGCGLAELALQRTRRPGAGSAAGQATGPGNAPARGTAARSAGRHPPGRARPGRRATGVAPVTLLAAGAAGSGVWLSLAWVAIKVGALSYGGGFVIIPLMQADAVGHYHWLTGDQFLNAVALGQVTPGPVVQTVAVVGYGAAGLAGGLLAAVVAFAPSFAFILLGARHFGLLRGDWRAAAFLGGAGPAAIGAILGSAIPLTRELTQAWQYGVLAAAVLALLVLRRGVVSALLLAGAAGVLVALAGGPLPH